MACTTAISLVANTIKKFHIQYSLNYVYQQNLYHNKQDIMDELFHKYQLPLLRYIEHPALITEWKQNLDYDSYEKYKQRNKSAIKEKIN